MALYTVKEFATRSGLTLGNLGNYIKRGKVTLTGEDRLIDASSETNKLFLEKRLAKMKPAEHLPPEPIIKEEKSHELPSVKEIESIDDSELPTYIASERKLKYLDTLKRQKEIEKLEVDVAKKKGEVIPSELVKPLFLQHNQSIVTEFKNAADEIIRIFSQKKSLSVNEKAEIAGELVNCINSSINKATKLSVKAVKNIISEFAEKKGIGERG